MTTSVSESARAIAAVNRSKWRLDRARFETALRSRGVSKTVIAVEMGFGNGGREHQHAAQHLSTRLQGRPVRGEAILRAALRLSASPYDFAQPVEPFATADLKRCVAFLLSDPRALAAAKELALFAYNLLERLGIQDNEFEELYQTLAQALLTRMISGANQTSNIDREVQSYSPDVMRELRRLDIVRHYATLVRIAARRKPEAVKYTIDTTGMLTNFDSWDRPEYRQVVQADVEYIRAAPQRRAVVRMFAVDDRALSLASVENLLSAVSEQVRLGVDVRLKRFDRRSFDRAHVADLCMVGEWAMDAGLLEGLADDLTMPLDEMCVPVADTPRFRSIQRRIEWVTDPQAADRIIATSADLQELRQDLETVARN